MARSSVSFDAVRKSVEAHSSVRAQVNAAATGLARAGTASDLAVHPVLHTGSFAGRKLEVYAWPKTSFGQGVVLVTGPGFEPKLLLEKDIPKSTQTGVFVKSVVTEAKKIDIRKEAKGRGQRRPRTSRPAATAAAAAQEVKAEAAVAQEIKKESSNAQKAGEAVKRAAKAARAKKDKAGAERISNTASKVIDKVRDDKEEAKRAAAEAKRHARKADTDAAYKAAKAAEDAAKDALKRLNEAEAKAVEALRTLEGLIEKAQSRIQTYRHIRPIAFRAREIKPIIKDAVDAVEDGSATKSEAKAEVRRIRKQAENVADDARAKQREYNARHREKVKKWAAEHGLTGGIGKLQQLYSQHKGGSPDAAKAADAAAQVKEAEKVVEETKKAESKIEYITAPYGTASRIGREGPSTGIVYGAPEPKSKPAKSKPAKKAKPESPLKAALGQLFA